MIEFFFNIRDLINSKNLLCRAFRIPMYVIYKFILLQYGASIPLNTKFKSVPNFRHGLYGIFISGDAVVGNNVMIFQQVTIGSVTTNGSKNIGAPIIGDNVTIGAGAKIIGKVLIGNNVKIGANCVVVESIPDNATVVLSKPRLIIKGRNE